MRKVGLDYGDKTIGVAVSDEMGWTAQGVEVIRRKSKKDDISRLREIVKEYEVTEVVLGLPKNMDGSIGDRGQLSIQFGELLKEKLALPVHLWDERLTTVSAERTLLEANMSRKKRKQVIDKMAAVFILQSYLDAKK
ncbi:Holliday junction resolvase RuvX [Chengkuizengella axinellae]|uniref:Putative pre-16S rRNA nuclease n=1 Tax=Chengkuizengella axinellae TaxID=3064388 RepID=A0ABT9IUS4_9BACL|nr:Holliday junction resolvase RuvX [Chengkuizengella sp. 2205SS18-9]MDP5272807.1 Holliday junction resolvase RuvX [Chengkuizengella sp. 2205SS18-9]